MEVVVCTDLTELNTNRFVTALVSATHTSPINTLKLLLLYALGNVMVAYFVIVFAKNWTNNPLLKSYCNPRNIVIPTVI